MTHHPQREREEKEPADAMHAREATRAEPEDVGERLAQQELLQQVAQASVAVEAV